LSFETAFCSSAQQQHKSKQASKNINTVIVIAAFLSFFPPFSICFLCNPSLQNGEKRREERRRRRRKQQEKRNAHPHAPGCPVTPKKIS
jgi:hypothetical protein